MFTYQNTRQHFLDFYTSRDHQRLQGSNLIPLPGDRVLYTTSGMHPLTPFLQGETHPQGRRLTNLQRCLRTTDLDEVGDSTHLTVFQMLGSWSLGDYTGSTSLRWGFEFLTVDLSIPQSHLYTTVFKGDGQVGIDQESFDTWTDLGVPIELLGSDNWWSNGPTGPCGPDSEIFYWTGEDSPVNTPSTDERWVEIWNHVMMRYLRKEDGSLTPLVQQNVDTGMGMERLLMVLEGKNSVYECGIFEPWMRILPQLWTLSEKSLRIVSDHLRSSMVIIGDGILPSNTGRGYILRRLLRRTLTELWQEDSSFTLRGLPQELVEHTGDVFEQELPENLLEILIKEEEKFRSLLQRGKLLVEKELRKGPLDEQSFHYLHDTHGVPRELVELLQSESRV